MLFGIGIDIMEIENVKQKLNILKTLDGIFTKREQAYIQISSIHAARRAAGIFCAKEACVKALGTGFSEISPHDIEVAHTASGQPYLVLSGPSSATRELCFTLSISHCKEYAVAVTVVCSRGEREKEANDNRLTY